MSRIRLIGLFPGFWLAVMGAAFPACCADVHSGVLEASPKDAMPCEGIDPGARLSAREFVDVVDCSYPHAEGWRLVRLGAGARADDFSALGRSRFWEGLLVHTETPTPGTRLGYAEGVLHSNDVSLYCEVEGAMTVPDSEAIVTDAVARHGSVSPETWIDFSAFHGCSPGAPFITSFNVTIYAPDKGSDTYIYAADGTFTKEKGD
jgi:hypothetical protein